jgi:hypothetical protein
MLFPPERGPRRPMRLAALVCALALLSGCIHLDIQRETQTSGTFESTGWAFTFLSWDIPKAAHDIARENVSDARLPNVEITYSRVRPNWGWFDWIFDIIGVRYAKIQGTWGFAGEPGEASVQ